MGVGRFVQGGALTSLDLLACNHPLSTAGIRHSEATPLNTDAIWVPIDSGARGGTHVSGVAKTLRAWAVACRLMRGRGRRLRLAHLVAQAAHLRSQRANLVHQVALDLPLFSLHKHGRD